ncbi:uncharacterized protein TNCV_448391 [Trichonephila clavipes]|nr:uncharacterized protein TNCV_448391 [Trichonephila clavipes]
MPKDLPGHRLEFRSRVEWLLHVKSYEAQHLHVGIMWKLGEQGKLAFRNPLHDPRVYEGAPPGIHVHTVHAYDPGRKSVMYNLLDVRDHTYFSMDSSSGNISTAKTIDKKIGDTYEPKGSWEWTCGRRVFSSNLSAAENLPYRLLHVYHAQSSHVGVV